MNEHTWRKRALAGLLAVMMVFTMVPAVANEYLGDVPGYDFGDVPYEAYDAVEIMDETVRWTVAQDEVVPMSGDTLAWYLEITPELVDALNARDGTMDFGVIVSGDDALNIPNFEYIPGATPGLRVYNRGMPYHALEVVLRSDYFDLLVPGIVYNVVVTGTTTAGEFFRIDVPGDGNAAGGSWEIVSSPATSATGATLPLLSAATFVGQPLDGYPRARIRTNTPWQAPFTNGNPGDTPELTITGVELWAVDPGPIDLIYNLREDTQIQEYLSPGQALTGFNEDFLATSGNPGITIVRYAELDLNYLRFPPRNADYDAIRVGGPTTDGGSATGIDGQLAVGNVLTVRGSISGAPPAGGMVIAIDQATAPHAQGASANIIAEDGTFAISHTITADCIDRGLNIRTRAPESTAPLTGMFAVPFYIFDLAVTSRPFVGSAEMTYVLGRYPGYVDSIDTLESVTPPPATIDLTEPHAFTVDGVIGADAVPNTVAVTTTELTPTLPLDWAVVGTFDPAPGAVNDFTWTVVLGDVLQGEVPDADLTGTTSIASYAPDTPEGWVAVAVLAIEGYFNEFPDFTAIPTEDALLSQLLTAIGALPLSYVAFDVDSITIVEPFFPDAGSVTISIIVVSTEDPDVYEEIVIELPLPAELDEVGLLIWDSFILIFDLIAYIITHEDFNPESLQTEADFLALVDEIIEIMVEEFGADYPLLAQLVSELFSDPEYPFNFTLPVHGTPDAPAGTPGSLTFIWTLSIGTRSISAGFAGFAIPATPYVTDGIVRCAYCLSPIPLVAPYRGCNACAPRIPDVAGGGAGGGMVAGGGGRRVGGGGGGIFAGGAVRTQRQVTQQPVDSPLPATEAAVVTAAAGAASVNVPLATLQTASSLQVVVDNGSVTFPAAAVSAMAAQGNDLDVTLDISFAATSTTSASLAFSVASAGSTISTFAAPATVSVNANEIPFSNGARVVAVAANGDFISGNMSGNNFAFTTSTTGNFSVQYFTNLRHIVVQIGATSMTCRAGNAPTQFLDVAPVIVGDRTMLPVRFMAYALGAQVDWTPATDFAPLTVHLTLDGTTLSFGIGEMAPGMDVPAQIINDRTMVPLRFISEFFGAQVEWDAATQTVEVFMA